MLDWAALAIAGTFASGLVQKGGKYLFETAGGGIVEEQGDKMFCRIVKNIADKFKINTPAENHELVKAFRRACIVGMQHVCTRRKTSIGSDNAPLLISKPRNLLLGNTPASLFAEDEKQWISKADKYLQNKIDEIDRELVWLPDPPSEEYQMLVVPTGVSNAVRADQFRRTLTRDAIAELSEEVEPPPDVFVDEMEMSWFGLVCNEFQDAIARNQLLANKFQNQTLVEIKSDTGEVKFTLMEVLELLRELTRRRQQVARTIVSNLPNLKVTVYDRVNETVQILRALREDSAQFHLIVAPTGFGKTFLLTRILQDVTDGTVILPAYEKTVHRIVVFNCRVTKTLAKVVGYFADLLDRELEYAPRANEESKEWLNRHLFPAVRQAGTVWLVLENFEAWLAAENDFTVKEPEMRIFLNALFEGNHSLRVLCFSQAEPASDVTKRFRQPPGVGEQLYKGLPETDAIDYLRIEGANVGLDRADEELLEEFLRRVAYIPQALNSLVGYLETIKDYDFIEFMADTELWTGFNAYEHERDEQDEGKRRTKALVAKQILAQSEDVKLLLRAQAFFSKPIPREALESLFDNKTQAAQAISRLTAHRLATVTGDMSRTKYYELHAYFLEQARTVLPPLDDLDETMLEHYAEKLAFAKTTEANNRADFNRAISLAECAEKIYNMLFERRGRVDIQEALAGTYCNKGVSLHHLGRRWEALAEYEKSILIYERLMSNEESGVLADRLASAYTNRGAVLNELGKSREAISEHDKAILIRERLVSDEGHRELADSLAAAHVNKGKALNHLGRIWEAIAEFDKSIFVYERLVNDEGRGELADKLATTHMSKGSAIASSGRPWEAIAEYDKAILIYERLVNDEGRGEFANNLAATYVNKGTALNLADRPSEAIAEYDKAILIRERLVINEGHGEFADSLAGSYVNKSTALIRLGSFAEAIAGCDKAIEIYERLIMDEGRSELAYKLALAHMSKGNTIASSGRPQEAITEYDKAILIYERLVNNEGRFEFAKDLAGTYLNKALSLEETPDWENALACYKDAIELQTKCIDELDRVELLRDLIVTISYRFQMLFKFERWNEAAQDVVKAALLIQYYSAHPKLSEQFKVKIYEEFWGIIYILRQSSDSIREKTYQAMGKNGEAIRKLVED